MLRTRRPKLRYGAIVASLTQPLVAPALDRAEFADDGLATYPRQLRLGDELVIVPQNAIILGKAAQFQESLPPHEQWKRRHIRIEEGLREITQEIGAERGAAGLHVAVNDPEQVSQQIGFAIRRNAGER